MKVAAAAAAWSSSSVTGSSERSTEAATSVGARSSLAAASGPGRLPSALASDCGPSTRKRHGFVRLWLGAQRASSKSSSSVARSTGSGS